MAMILEPRAADAPAGAAMPEDEGGRQPLLAVPLPSRRHLWWMHWTWVYVGFILGIATNRRHDYWSYVEQWRLVLDGKNPWSPLPPEFGINSYGPVHNLLGVLLPIDVLAPKAFIIALYGLAATFLLKRLLRERYDWRALGLYVLAVPGNLLITSFGFNFGSNDLVVGAFLIFAILARLDGRTLLPAFWLGLAILLKFYPVLFVPLFMIRDDRRIDFGLGFAVALIVAAGMAAGYWIWGAAVLDPYRAAVVRHSSFLSVFATVERYGVYVADGRISGWLLKYNTALVFLAAAGTALWSWLSGRSWLICLLLVVLASLLGHQQFLVPWCSAVACLPLLKTPEADATAWGAMPLMLFLSVFSLIQVVYDPILYLDENVRLLPFLAFPAGVVSLWLMIRDSRRPRDR